MKKTYEGLEMEVIRFSTEDIITTSDAATDAQSDAATDNNQSATNGGSSGDITYTPVEGYLAVFLGSDGNYYSLNLSTNEYELIGPELPTSEEGV